MSRRNIFIISGIVIVGVLYYVHPILFGLYRDFTGREENDQSLPAGVLLPEAGIDILRLGILPKGFPRMLISPQALRGISAKETTSLGGLQQQTVAYRAPLPLKNLEAFYLDLFKAQGFTLIFTTSKEQYATFQAARRLESVHVVLTARTPSETKASVVYEKIK